MNGGFTVIYMIPENLLLLHIHIYIYFIYHDSECVQL